MQMKAIKAEDMAMEIGQRCRRVRMAHGLSQQALADLAGTTAQNISKYEKNGISDIFWIKKLSELLGTDLQNDEIDKEGSVGEIGKEILYTLVLYDGHVDTCCFSAFFLYGLDEQRVSNEIFKLESIGMVVREQYKGWLDKEKDVTFITAKGLITLKNMQLNNEMSEKVFELISEIKTYEQIRGLYKNYQEFIDDHQIEKLIRNIDYDSEYMELYDSGECEPDDKYLILCTDYRCNYLKYLRENFLEGFENLGQMELLNVLKYHIDIDDSKVQQWIPGKGIYHDIIFRMALEITSQDLWLDSTSYKDLFFNLCDEVVEMANSMNGEIKEINTDRIVGLAEIDLKKEFCYRKPNLYDEKLKHLNLPQIGFGGDDVYEFIANLEDMGYEVRQGFIDKLLTDSKMQEKISQFNLLFKSFDRTIQEIYEENADINESPSPTEWFTKEEIEEYINTYMGPAKRKEEKKLDEILEKINQLCPRTLDYYRFPKEWEENGLADLVRKNYNIPKISEE